MSLNFHLSASGCLLLIIAGILIDYLNNTMILTVVNNLYKILKVTPLAIDATQEVLSKDIVCNELILPIKLTS